MQDRKDVTVPMPESLSDAIEGELEYGDSKAGWIREAIEQRLAAERDTGDEHDTDTDADADADAALC